MARGLNKVMLIGNLGKDPQLDYTQSGMARCRFSIATTEQYTDKDGQKQEQTDWHNIVLWGRTAEIAGEFLKKGRTVYIEGRIRTRQYEDNEGQTKYITEITGFQLLLLGGPGGGRGEEAPPPEEPEGMGGSQERGGGKARGGAKPAEPAREEEDDLPF